MTVMEMLAASIPLEVTTAVVTLAMREMDSTAQVTQSCEVHTTHMPITLTLLCVYEN